MESKVDPMVDEAAAVPEFAKEKNTLLVEVQRRMAALKKAKTLTEWVDAHTPRVQVKDEVVALNKVGETAVARALGMSVRQLNQRLNRDAHYGRPTKPAPYFRAALVDRQNKARGVQR